MRQGAIQVFPSAVALAYGAAERIAGVLHAAVSAVGSASVALSGGSTPAAVYRLLATADYARRVDWKRVHVFWGDERCVPADAPESNYRMAHQEMLRHLPIDPRHIHRIHGEYTPVDAAKSSEAELHAVLGPIPRLTLVLLGVGEDGHTASLFPGTRVVEESRRLVAEVFVPRLNAWRVTMTLPVLNNAAHTLILVSGTSKAPVLQSLATTSDSSLPVSRIRPVDGEVQWYADQDAASLLDTSETA